MLKVFCKLDTVNLVKQIDFLCISMNNTNHGDNLKSALIT